MSVELEEFDVIAIAKPAIEIVYLNSHETGNQILKNKLYVPGWRLYSDAIDFKQLSISPLRFGIFGKDSISNKFIAVATFDQGLVQCFVVENYRKKGIASALLSALKQKTIELEVDHYKPYARHGCSGSGVFFAKNSIKVVGGNEDEDLITKLKNKEFIIPALF